MSSLARKMTIGSAVVGLLTVVAVCYSSGALPIARISKGYQNIYLADFIPTQTAIENHTLTPEIAGAAVKLTVIDGKGHPLEDCTGTVISDTGVILTAGHCIDRCKIKNFTVDRDMNVTVDNSKRLPTLCQIEVNGVRMPLDVIDTDGCPRYRPPNGNKPFGCSLSDWALIQTDQRKTGNLPCLEIENTRPAYQAHVITLGYPFSTFRRLTKGNALDSDGHSEYVSYGSIIPFQNFCAIDLDDKTDSFNGRRPLDDQGLLGQIRDAVDSGFFYQSDLDVARGSSGGPLILSSDQKLLGITLKNLGSTDDFECRGSTFFESIGSIRMGFQKLNPSVNVESVFNCQAH